MTVTATTFRQTFRAFNDPDLSPDDAVAYYIGLAQNFLSTTRFDAVSYDRAVGLFVAHHLVLDARDANTFSTTGGIPGELTGPETSKAVDKVSVSMDTQRVTWENEPFWNQTRFGVQLIDLVRMFGAGGLQIGVPSGCE